MDILSKNKILSILVLGLILLNTLLISALWIFLLPHEKDNKDANSTIENDIINFFRKELSFNDLQTESLKSLYHDYLMKSSKMRDEIKILHNSINYKVLTNQTVNQISVDFKELGDKKADLDIVSYQFFWDLRHLCKDNQLLLFDEMFRDIIRIINKPSKK